MSSFPAQSELNWLRHVIPEYGFQEIKERTLARVPLFRYQQEYGKFLQWLQEQQLQIVQSQIVLFPENV